MDGGERIRLFCAFELPSGAVERLGVWQRELPAGAYRPVPAASLHVTLAFLGATPAGRVGEVGVALRSAVGAASRPAFTAVRYRETRSAGMIVLDDAAGRGAAVADALARELEDRGLVRREARPWLPHVTVVRFRRRPHLDPPVPDLGRVEPSDASVIMSLLRPTGAQYERIESVALGG